MHSTELLYVMQLEAQALMHAVMHEATWLHSIGVVHTPLLLYRTVGAVLC